jgi:hypothetical protein
VAAGVGVALYGGVAIAALLGVGGGVYWVALGGGTVLLVAGLRLAPKAQGGRVLLLVLVGGALFRAVLVPTEPVLSDDIWHYLWDGRLAAADVNPYAYRASDPALAPLRDDRIYPRLPRPEAPTVYPPVSQLVVEATWRAGLRTPQAFKVVAVAADVAAAGLLAVALRQAGRDPRLAVAYAWHPLPILAFGHSGHGDSLAVLALVAAAMAWQRGRLWPAGALMGLAAGVKLIPLLLLPAFVRPRNGGWSWRWALGLPTIALAVLALAYVPYLYVGQRVLGYLTGGYLEREGYESGRRFLLARVVGLDGRVLVAVVAPVVVGLVLRSLRPAAARAAWILGAALVLTTPYPWYAAPLIALAVLGGAGWAWGWFALALEVAYVSLFFGPPGIRLAEWIRFPAALAITLAALLSWRLAVARRAVLVS